MEWEGNPSTPDFVPDFCDLNIATQGPAVVPGTGGAVRTSRVRHKKSASDTFAWAAAPYVDFTDANSLLNLVESGYPDELNAFGESSAQQGPFSWGVHSGGWRNGNSIPSRGLSSGPSVHSGGVRSGGLPPTGPNLFAGGSMRPHDDAPKSQPTPSRPLSFLHSSSLPPKSPVQLPPLSGEMVGHDQVPRSSPDPSKGPTHRRGASLDDSGHTGFSKTMKESLGADKPLPNFATQTRANAFDPAQLDPKRAKRIIANRQSAHRSRVKKLQQVHGMEQELAKIRSDAQGLQEQVKQKQLAQKEMQAMAHAKHRENINLLNQLKHGKTLGQLMEREIARLQELLSTQALVRPDLLPAQLVKQEPNQMDASGMMDTDDKILADMWS